MSSEGAVTRSDEENLSLFESLLFHQFGNSYRSFIRDSPITDRLERMSEFIKHNFGLSNGIEYTRFMAETRCQIPANFIVSGHSGSSQTAQNVAGHLNSNWIEQNSNIVIDGMLAEDIKIEFCPNPIENGHQVVEVQQMPNGIKRENGPEVFGSLSQPVLLSCGQCPARSGDFRTMVELEEHIKEIHEGGQSLVSLPNKKFKGFKKRKRIEPSTSEESLKNNIGKRSKRPRLTTSALPPPKNAHKEVRSSETTIDDRVALPISLRSPQASGQPSKHSPKPRKTSFKPRLTRSQKQKTYEGSQQSSNQPGNREIMSLTASLPSSSKSTLKRTPKAPVRAKKVVPKRLSKSVTSSEMTTKVSLVKKSKGETSKTRGKGSAKGSKSKDGLLFDGMQFFLTATGGGDPSLIGASIGQSIKSYDRDEFGEKLMANGGKVVDFVENESKSKKKYGIFLISDSHARTVKYIYCLAAGIPIISFNWVSDCISQNKLADWRDYQINAGWSIEKGMVMPIHKEKPLRGLKIFILSDTHEDLFNYWRPILIAAKADLLKPKKKKEIPPETDVLVTDTSREHPALDYARENEIPIVRPEWLVQTLICGERVEYDGHEKYLVQIEDTEDEETEGSQ